MAAVCVSLVAACAFVQFEKGAYVVRDLTAVYSQQEDVTFLSWKLREDANVGEVTFELYRGGSYERIDLDEAYFPAEPYECDGDRLCFQYQVDGNYTLPSGRSAIRTRHVDRGIFAGDSGDGQKVETTFGLEPIGVDNNGAYEPTVADWFEENGVPLRRGWQWQLVGAEGTVRAPQNCRSPEDGSWRSITADRARGGAIGLSETWLEAPTCVAVRPDGQTIDEAVAVAPLPPSAETSVLRQSYEPDRIDAPIYYGVLLDMSIQNEERCESVRSQLLETISSAVQAEGDPTKLGGYRPISPESGQPLNGCDQVSGRTYPINRMIQDAAEVDGQLSPRRVRFVFIYINNSPLPLSESIRQDLLALTTQLGEQNDLNLSNWAIGSGRVLQLAEWGRQIGWRPISSDTFRGAIESTADSALPYATMDHENDRNISLDGPESGPRPRRFKVCRSTPVSVRIGSTAEPPMFGASDPSAPWPASAPPYIRVSFPPQILVPDAEYRTRRVDMVIEVCTRFCDQPFESQGGGRYDSWSQTAAPQPMEVCKWQP